jgi:hypothetical protein
VKRDEVFHNWAPPSSVWTRWVKPVLFAHVRTTQNPTPSGGQEPSLTLGLSDVVPPDPRGAPYRSGGRPNDTAIIVDLPGIDSVRAGVALAKLGFRPVPLFNAYPANGAAAAIDLWPIIDALIEGAAALGTLTLRDDAPPAFLLDANRRGPKSVGNRVFDNRSVCTTADFPTGRGLAARGIAHVVLLREATGAVLPRMQAEGLVVHETAPIEAREPAPLRVALPSAFARFWEGFFRWTLSPNDEGAFGRMHAS